MFWDRRSRTGQQVDFIGDGKLLEHLFDVDIGHIAKLSLLTSF